MDSVNKNSDFSILKFVSVQDVYQAHFSKTMCISNCIINDVTKFIFLFHLIRISEQKFETCTIVFASNDTDKLTFSIQPMLLHIRFLKRHLERYKL